MKSFTRIAIIASFVLSVVTAADAAIVFDANVTPDVIFGDGNANGSFTVDRANGVELGLRAKLRHDAGGSPQNIFNSNGDGTYTFSPGVAPTQSFPTAEWSFEWTINTDYNNSSGWDLDDLTYELAMTSNVVVSMPTFDPINDTNIGLAPPRVQWDHSIGDNTTTEATDLVIPNSANDEAGYLANIAANNVAQQSWKPHWTVPSFNPNSGGTYDFTLKAFSGSTEVASTAMSVIVIPTPAAAFGALPLLGVLGIRRRRN